jgi:hypothetical protein
MRNISVKIKTIILIAACLMFLFSQIGNADDTNWKNSLTALMIKYPSLFDDEELVPPKVYELLNKHYQNPDSNVKISDFPSDFVFFDGVIGSGCMPFRYKFYDLDFDGIPEVIIDFGALQSGAGWREVYKFYDDSYEQIGSLHGGEYYESLYINPENKIVSVQTGTTQVFEIENKKIIYSKYIDSTGNDMFNGVKYDEIGNYTEFFAFETYEDYLNSAVFLAELRYIPEFDCSDVLGIIKYGAELSPKTGDKFLVFYIIFISPKSLVRPKAFLFY